MFLQKKGIDRPRVTKLCTFPSSNPELAKMTFDQNYDRPSGHKSLCEVRDSNVPP